MIAEFERDSLARTKEGMDRARANGVKFGRKQRLSDESIEHLRALRGQGASYGSLAKTFKVSPSTVRNYACDMDMKC